MKLDPAHVFMHFAECEGGGGNVKNWLKLQFFVSHLLLVPECFIMLHLALKVKQQREFKLRISRLRLQHSITELKRSKASSCVYP